MQFWGWPGGLRGALGEKTKGVKNVKYEGMLKLCAISLSIPGFNLCFGTAISDKDAEKCQKTFQTLLQLWFRHLVR